MGSTLVEESGPVRAAARACAREIEDYFSRVVAELDVLAERLVDVCAGVGTGATGERPTAADIVAVAGPPTRAMLHRLPLFGGGFVAAPGFLADQHLYLAWWQGEEQQLLAQSTVSGSGDPLDYSRLEWFHRPIATGRVHVTGPYVDYVCSDESMLTTTTPVLVAGAAVGVVGADTLLDTFESLMLPAVRAAGATVVNQANRVVLSADPRVPPGRLVAGPAQAGEQPGVVPCRGLPLTVLTG
ncbi:PDC sensor domain-containing protein [Nocardioides sp. zg-536]|uniref:PDC sensor domain-containing protein n=1 Tax=Nocardioides faecalis TaxID=2803858 RepID=A0A939BVW7_9ACTN|nr:cache domain-containing protein [Nocardioides faecalis]MBM9459972.1 PDC sensor domain-containing protein [Nocardioides faecalis]MBS4753158.1 PDC sensor domain-containing protein [Nocardioides faecalis]QVI58805.1 PDC sensor domain-containing protein [Nocardioides faecalis]